MPRIKDLTAKSGNLSNADFFATDNGTLVTKIDYTALAKAIIEQYNGSTLAGSAQSVQAALNSLNSNLNNRLTGIVKSVSANVDTNITIPNNYRGSVAFIGYDVDCDGLLMIAASSAGTVTYKWIGDAPSNITLATATRRLTVTSTQGVYLIFTNANQAIS